MKTRKELKRKARKALFHQYFKSVLLCFVFTIVFGGGYTFVTGELLPRQEENVLEQAVSHVENFDPHHMKDSIVGPFEKKLTGKPHKKYTRGVFAIFANQVNTTGSLVLGLLNACNHLIFGGSGSVFLILILGVFINLLFYIFVKNILAVGKCRYFLENRKYKKTNYDRLLFIYRVRKTWNTSKAMMRVTLYQLLWNLTLVGGIIKHYSYLLVPYILAENPSITGKDAITMSRKMMDGYKWYAFQLDCSLLLWFVLGIFTFQFVDVLFLTPYYQTILAEFYMEVRMHAKKKEIESISLLNDTYLEGDVVNGSYPKDKSVFPKSAQREWLRINYKRDYSPSTLILLFFTFSIVGWLWEVSLHLFQSGVFVNRGTLFGPWLPIYGWGGVLILILLKPFRENPWLTFFFTLILCGIIEYSTAWYLEVFKHMKWWDYTGYFLNLDGRICLEGLLVFGLGGCGFTYLLAPILDNLYRKIPKSIQVVLCTLLIFFFLLDNLYSHFYPNSGKGITDYEACKVEGKEKYNTTDLTRIKLTENDASYSFVI